MTEYEALMELYLGQLENNAPRFAKLYDNWRINFSRELAQLTNGLVIDGFMGRYRYGRANSNVILLKPDNSFDGMQREATLTNLRQRYNNPISYILIRNTYAANWSLGMVFVEDLKKTPEILEIEGHFAQDSNIKNAKDWAILAMLQDKRSVKQFLANS